MFSCVFLKTEELILQIKSSEGKHSLASTPLREMEKSVPKALMFETIPEQNDKWFPCLPNLDYAFYFASALGVWPYERQYILSCLQRHKQWEDNRTGVRYKSCDLASLF